MRKTEMNKSKIVTHTHTKNVGEFPRVPQRCTVMKPAKLGEDVREGFPGEEPFELGLG